MLKEPSDTLITSNKYLIRFASDPADIEAAQRLRFQVFNLEMGEGLSSSWDTSRDVDSYDEQCHHLLVIDRQNDEIIGTYRMQAWENAQKRNGYYTGDEFDLSGMPAELLEQSVEVGRACIAKDHRNGRVLYLLWRGLASYLKDTGSRYLLGCCSITSQKPEEAWQVIDYLGHNGHRHPEICVPATEAYRCEEAGRDPEAWKKVQLPQLFRLYMDLGAKVCSEPALDREFKTIDYLVVLDVEALDERTRLLFFK